MSDYQKIRTSYSPGFLGLLGIVFITLKLTHYIDWSWIWVLAPLWGSVVLWIFCFVVWILIVVFTDGRKRN